MFKKAFDAEITYKGKQIIRKSKSVYSFNLTQKDLNEAFETVNISASDNNNHFMRKVFDYTEDEKLDMQRVKSIQVVGREIVIERYAGLEASGPTNTLKITLKDYKDFGCASVQDEDLLKYTNGRPKYVGYVENSHFALIDRNIEPWSEDTVCP